MQNLLVLFASSIDSAKAIVLLSIGKNAAVASQLMTS